MPGFHQRDIPHMDRKAGDKCQISDNFEASGAYITGKITNEERLDIVRNSCPGPGACGECESNAVCLRWTLTANSVSL